MAPRGKKLGLSIPTDPRIKGFDGPFLLSQSPFQTAPSPLSSPSRSTSPSPPQRLPSPSIHHRLPSPLSVPPPPPPPPCAPPSSTAPATSDSEMLQRLVHAPKSKRRAALSRQMSMCVTSRDVAWERKRRQMLGQERRRKSVDVDLTDEDLRELKGSIELGFGFNEEAAGSKLCNTLPALDLYFAVNRQLSCSPVSSPRSVKGSSSRASSSSSSSSSSVGSSSLSRSASMGCICSPGDDPQQVKMKLRHWAQAVACSVMQST